MSTCLFDIIINLIFTEKFNNTNSNLKSFLLILVCSVLTLQ